MWYEQYSRTSNFGDQKKSRKKTPKIRQYYLVAKFICPTVVWILFGFCLVVNRLGGFFLVMNQCNCGGEKSKIKCDFLKYKAIS